MTAPAVRGPVTLQSWTDLEGRVCYRFTLPVVPRTKKTSNRAWRTGKRCRACHLGTGSIRVMPSEAFVEMQRAAVKYAADKPELKLYLSGRVNCRALFYRDADRGDASAYYQALADVLEHLQVVINDRFLVSWNGSELRKDADNPRIEITLTVLPHDRQEEIDL